MRFLHDHSSNMWLRISSGVFVSRHAAGEVSRRTHRPGHPGGWNRSRSGWEPSTAPDIRQEKKSPCRIVFYNPGLGSENPKNQGSATHPEPPSGRRPHPGWDHGRSHPSEPGREADPPRPTVGEKQSRNPRRFTPRAGGSDHEQPDSTSCEEGPHMRSGASIPRR